VGVSGVEDFVVLSFVADEEDGAEELVALSLFDRMNAVMSWPFSVVPTE